MNLLFQDTLDLVTPNFNGTMIIQSDTILAYQHSPDIFSSANAVKAMPFHRRQCLLPDDDISSIKPKIRLDAFKNYSRTSCALECTTREQKNPYLLQLTLAELNKPGILLSLGNLRKFFSHNIQQSLHPSASNAEIDVGLKAKKQVAEFYLQLCS